MIHTITNYRPGIYGEIARRAQARADREERACRLLDCAADVIGGTLAVVFLLWATWFCFTALCQ